jgi:hypothetical protein
MHNARERAHAQRMRATGRRMALYAFVQLSVF